MSDSEKIVQEVDIVTEIGDHVKLTRTGVNYKGLCPFHGENTPSFVVSQNKKIFKCFGCGKSGSVIQFIMYRENLSYVESLIFLAEKYGITLSKRSEQDIETSKKESRQFEILHYAMEYFQRQLSLDEGKIGLEYFLKRGLSEESIEKNYLGYAPDSWEGLSSEMLQAGYLVEELIELGLVSEGKEGKIFDFFRNRAIFPILNEANRVAGFGGRAVDGNSVKYINSIESNIFKKNQLLYGLIKKGEFIKKRDFVIVTEGYMDTLSLHQLGLKNCVASLGTAFTKEHLKMISKYTKNVVIGFDMDLAGEVASEQLSILFKKAGFNIKRLKLLDAKDPDEYIKKFGKNAFVERLKDSQEVFDYLYSRYSQPLQLDTLEGKKEIIKRFKPFFECVTQGLEYDVYSKKLSDYLNIPYNAILMDLPFVAKGIKMVEKHASYGSQNRSKLVEISIDKQSVLERETMRLLIHSPKLKKEFEVFGVEFMNDKFQKYYDFLDDMDINDALKMMKLFEVDEIEEVIELSMKTEIENFDELKSDLISQWRNIVLTEELMTLQARAHGVEVTIEERQGIFSRIREIQMTLKNNGGIKHG
ncbi:MAG: DNA primase [Fusobacteria bacterium]|nr:DNA primase [Fusobacteriota bacterium]